VKNHVKQVDRALWRDAAAIGAAAGVIGVSFGAIAVAAGLPTWAPIVMSLLVFAGGSQFLAVALIAAGNPLAAVFGGLLINARHLPFGLAIGSAIADNRGAALLGAHLVIDETTAFTLAQPDHHKRRHTFWVVGGVLFVLWNLGTAIGVGLGSAMGDPQRFGLDAAFPAGLLALLWPSLRDRTTLIAAVSGATIAVLSTPLLPAGLPVLLGLLGVGVALLAPAPKPKHPPVSEPAKPTVRGGQS
jgi:4-azaleucine resistance transporter AzlC